MSTSGSHRWPPGAGSPGFHRAPKGLSRVQDEWSRPGASGCRNGRVPSAAARLVVVATMGRSSTYQGARLRADSAASTPLRRQSAPSQRGHRLARPVTRSCGLSVTGSSALVVPRDDPNGTCVQSVRRGSAARRSDRVRQRCVGGAVTGLVAEAWRRGSARSGLGFVAPRRWRGGLCGSGRAARCVAINARRGIDS